MKMPRLTGSIIVMSIAVSVVLAGMAYAAVNVFYNSEAEAGTRLGNVALVSDTSAAGGSAVKFGVTSSVPSPLKILPLGDSLTQGCESCGTANGYRLPLWNLLSDYTINYVGPYQYGGPPLIDTDMAGESGACIKTTGCGGSTMYPLTAGWLNTYNPDLVIMQGGGNDYSGGWSNPDATIEGFLEDWIQLVWATKPNAKIIVSGQAQWHPELEAMNKAYVEGLQAQGKAIRFVPFAATVGTDANTVDLTHPNNAGFQLWAEELEPMVRELFPQ